MRICNGTVFIDKLRGLNPDSSGMTLVDEDGAALSLSNDAVAHIVSMAFHKLERQMNKDPTLKDVLDHYCTCPVLPEEPL